MDIDYVALSTALIYLVTFLIVCAESGVFFLFFLPGDSLLFALGLLAHQGVIHVGYIIPLLIVAAIAGNFFGYFLGRITRGGIERGKWLPRIKASYLDKARMFYERHGVWAVFFARFVPVVRTFVPFFAGVVSMHKRRFALWTVLGGVVWITTVTLVGYFFGQQFHLENIAFLGTGVILVAAVATPVCIALINRLFKRSV
jgi:membrane-associated protein